MTVFRIVASMMRMCQPQRLVCADHNVQATLWRCEVVKSLNSKVSPTMVTGCNQLAEACVVPSFGFDTTMCHTIEPHWLWICSTESFHVAC